MYSIGIFGGSFNPIHTGHLIVANEAINRFNLDKIFFIPTINPFKDNCILPMHRYNMTKLAIFDNPYFEVLDIEIKKTLPSYTIDTIKYLFSKYKETSFFLIMGSDLIDQFNKWKDYEKIAEMVKFIIYNRDSKNDFFIKVEKFLKITKNIFTIEEPVINISSSMIREYVKKGYSIKYLVPEFVLEYIKENGLYL